MSKEDEWDEGWYSCYDYLKPEIENLRKQIKALEDNLEANKRTIKLSQESKLEAIALKMYEMAKEKLDEVQTGR